MSTRLATASDATASALMQALAYRERGWSVVPLYPRKKRPNGYVLLDVRGDSSWATLRKRPATATEITSWFEHEPALGIGVLTGQPSGGLVVADYDVPIDTASLPPTPTARGERGAHVYLHASSEIKSRRFKHGCLKAEGGFVVTPPSRHPNGHTYQWLTPPEVDCLPLAEFDLNELAPDSKPHFQTGLYQGEYILLGTEVLQNEKRHRNVEALLGAGAVNLADPSRREELLRTLDGCDEYVEALARKIGIPPVGLGRAFRCVLPDHAETHASAALWRGEDGLVVYRDFHHLDEPGAFSLTTVYVASVTGQILTLKPPSYSRWKLRSLHATALVELPEVPLPPGRGLSANAERLRDGFELLARTRALTEPLDAPMPFTRRFAAPWCGLSERAVEEAKGELLLQNIIVNEGWWPSEDAQQRSALYVPGSGRTRAKKLGRTGSLASRSTVGPDPDDPVAVDLDYFQNKMRRYDLADNRRAAHRRSLQEGGLA